MKVKIKKKGKTKEYNLIKSWSDVTLEKWIKLIKLEGKAKGLEAKETIAVLSDITKKLITQLGIQDVSVLLNKISELQKKANVRLRNIIKVGNKEYGFHPNLEDITLGEWADLETFIKEGIEDNMPEIMAILYRPITEKENDVYTIEAYNGNINVRAEELKKMKAEQVQSCLVFFWSFVNVLLEILPSFLAIRLNKKAQDQKEMILQKNGVISE